MDAVRRLRIKFVALSSAAIFALLLLILGAVNGYNFSITANAADEVTSSIEEAGGNLSNILTPSNPTDTPQGYTVPDADSYETLASIRYFTFTFEEDDEEGQLLVRAMDSISDEEARDWASSLLKGPDKGWTRTLYRYRRYFIGSQTYVSVVDESRELMPSYRVLGISAFGIIFGTLISLGITMLVSKRMVKPLEESQDRQKRFISNASHELKTPLAIISANAELLEIELGENESTQIIHKQVERLNEMVKNLNALTKIDELSSSKFLEVNLTDLASESALSYAAAFKKADKVLLTDIDEDIRMKGDETSLAQLLSTILDNALKYAKSQAFFEVKKDEDGILIHQYNDCESPFPSGSNNALFERFYRSDSSRASSIEGSGIGLSMAKEIVINHKGKITAYGKKGKFHLEIRFKAIK